MTNVFEITDKTGRKIRLPNKQWRHIMKKHPYMEKYLEEIKETLKIPDKITEYSPDETIRYYYRRYKYVKSPNYFILVIVKYLNGEGFVITAYFTDKLK